MKGKITARQQEILDFIKKEILERGYPPAVREIGQAVHLKSTSSVHAHLESLEKNGYIRRDYTKPRAIEVLDDDFHVVRREIVQIPMIGEVTAGEPMDIERHIEGYIPMFREDVPSGKCFLFQVRDNSMEGVGIHCGDRILVHEENTAENGDMVVVWLDHAITVRTFYQEKGTYRLQPENKNMEPIFLEQVKILGKVAGLYRRYH